MNDEMSEWVGGWVGGWVGERGRTVASHGLLVSIHTGGQGDLRGDETHGLETESRRCLENDLGTEDDAGVGDALYGEVGGWVGGGGRGGWNEVLRAMGGWVGGWVGYLCGS